MISHLGAMSSVVAGKLMAKRMKGVKGYRSQDNWEGRMPANATHQGINSAAVERVPRVVATYHHYAYFTPNGRPCSCADL